MSLDKQYVGVTTTPTKTEDIGVTQRRLPRPFRNLAIESYKCTLSREQSQRWLRRRRGTAVQDSFSNHRHEGVSARAEASP